MDLFGTELELGVILQAHAVAHVARSYCGGEGSK